MPDCIRATVDRWRESQARRDFWEKAYREGLAAGRAVAEADHRAEAAARQRADQELADAALTAGQATGDEDLARRVYEARFGEQFADTYEATRRMWIGVATAVRLAAEKRGVEA